MASASKDFFIDWPLIEYPRRCARALGAVETVAETRVASAIQSASFSGGCTMTMNGNAYDSGRLNLPFVGICTFGKSTYQPDWEAIKADVAILGAPFDCGTQWRAGPRSIREASTLFSFGHGGAYDHEDDVTYLANDKVAIVDLGDAIA